MHLDRPDGEKMKLVEIQKLAKMGYPAFQSMDEASQQKVIATLEEERSTALKGTRSQPKARSQDVRRTTESIQSEVREYGFACNL